MIFFIIGGGDINTDFILRQRDAVLNFNGITKRSEYEIIACDRAASICVASGMDIDLAIGDFDSAATDDYEKIIAKEIKCIRLNPIKDDTDSQAAVDYAIEHNADRIYFFGATGGRMDHFIANLSLLYRCLSRNVKMYILDEKNRIQMVSSNSPFCIERANQYGKYVSFFSYQSRVKQLTLKGFKYPLYKYDFLLDDTRTVSNEIEDEIGLVTFESGNLIVIESMD